MQPLEWGEEFSVDIPQLDAQHRHIIELLGELRRNAHSAELVSTAFEQIIKYADWHLQREELMLRVRGYSGYAEHKAEHDAYREKVASLRAHSNRRDFGIRIANFLSKWWRHHILSSDQQYARFYRHEQPIRRGE
jgi:hemerythrin